jgi:hypothetical protein
MEIEKQKKWTYSKPIFTDEQMKLIEKFPYPLLVKLRTAKDLGIIDPDPEKVKDFLSDIQTYRGAIELEKSIWRAREDQQIELEKILVRQEQNKTIHRIF